MVAVAAAPDGLGGPDGFGGPEFFFVFSTLLTEAGIKLPLKMRH